MPIASRSPAKLAMKGWSIPAPAPCASTRHALARVGRCNSPDTLIFSLTGMVTGFGMGDFTSLLCTESQSSPAVETPVYDAAGRRIQHDFYTVSACFHQQFYGWWIYRRLHEYHDTPCPADEPGAACRRRHRPRPL